MNKIPSELIRYIMSYLDNKSVVSLLLVGKKICELSSQYRENIVKQALQRELYYVREYSYCTILKAGDRVIDDHHNFRIISICNQQGLMQQVDVFGNCKMHICPIFAKIVNNEYYWYYGTSYLYAGIRLYDDGPEINSIEDKYLKYKTVSKLKQTQPEVNMIVLLKIQHEPVFYYLKEYLITELSENNMKLRYIGGNPILLTIYNPLLENLFAYKRLGKWYTTNNMYKIYKFGGFGECIGFGGH